MSWLGNWFMLFLLFLGLWALVEWCVRYKYGKPFLAFGGLLSNHKSMLRWSMAFGAGAVVLSGYLLRWTGVLPRTAGADVVVLSLMMGSALALGVLYLKGLAKEYRID